jgi:thiosulfate/3-mercaptopyruvate sulfurtransferase
MNPLVSPAWLQARLHQPDIIVLDATLPPVGVHPAPDVRARYLAQHIPGALYFDIEGFSDHTTPLPHMLPSPAEFAAKASALGIDSSAEIVIYEQVGVFSAPRAWWMFRTMGVEKVYLLDGGLPAWTEAGYPVSSQVEHRAPTTFHAHFNADAVASYDRLQQSLKEHAQILDARSAVRFTGAAPEPRPGLSSGHMPGAISLPFTELVENGKLLPADRLQQTLTAKGIHMDKPITTTCGSGVTAAVLALALGIAGADKVHLYDGSWAEYAQQPDSVIEKGS